MVFMIYDVDGKENASHIPFRFFSENRTQAWDFGGFGRIRKQLIGCGLALCTVVVHFFVRPKKRTKKRAPITNAHAFIPYALGRTQRLRALANRLTFVCRWLNLA